METADTWSASDLHRPKLLKDFIGQEHVIDIIKGQIESGKFSKSYLITGEKGSGKTSLSRVLAKKIAGVKTHKHVDIIDFNASIDTGIDDVRTLVERIGFTPMSAKKKVLLVDEAHGLTGKAASALLGTLENPPEHAVVILLTNEDQKLLPTIRDRCKKLGLVPLGSKEIEEMLRRAADKEKVFQPLDKYDKLFKALGSIFQGRNRDALNTLSNLADIARSRKVSRDDIIKVAESTLGATYSDIPKFLGLLYKGKAGEAFEILERVTDYNGFTFVLLDINTYALKKLTGLKPKFNYGANILMPYLKGAELSKINKVQSILIELRRDATSTSAVAPEAILVHHAVRLGELF